MLVKQKQINPSGMDVNNNDIGAGVGPGPDSPGAASSNGRKYYPLTSTDTNVNPAIVLPNNFGERKDSPPTYSAKALTTTNQTALAMSEVNSITNLTKEDEKRREFFFQLKTALAQEINLQSKIGNPTSVALNNDNYWATTGGFDGIKLSAIVTCGLAECLIKGCSSKEIHPDINYFATRIALAIVYIYQDHIPILATQSYKKLIDCFVIIVKNYCFPKHNIRHGDSNYREDIPSDFVKSDVYEILMSSLNLRGSEGSGVFYWDTTTSRLRTDRGFEFSITQLFSTGVYTLDGGKLEPTHPDSQRHFAELKSHGKLPLYRWGTIDAYKLKDFSFSYVETTPTMQKIQLEIPKDTVLSPIDTTLSTTYPIAGLALQENKVKFWQKVIELAHHYLNQEEFVLVSPSTRPANYEPYNPTIQLLGTGTINRIDLRTGKISSYPCTATIENLGT